MTSPNRNRNRRQRRADLASLFRDPPAEYQCAACKAECKSKRSERRVLIFHDEPLCEDYERWELPDRFFKILRLEVFNVSKPVTSYTTGKSSPNILPPKSIPVSITPENPVSITPNDTQNVRIRPHDPFFGDDEP